jgi:hypothetical protein
MSKPELAKYYSESDGDARGYQHPNTGERVYGVTSISGRYSEGAGKGEGGLAQYAADVTLRWANDNWSLLGSRSDEQNYRNGRFRWKDWTNHLAQVGTDAHDYFEQDLVGGELPVMWGEALEVAYQWVDFRRQHWLDPTAVEVTVWNRTLGYAGTLDVSGYLDGVLTLLDAKTSRLLRENHRIQVAALAKAEFLMVKHEDGTWTEEAMPEWEQFGFIHLRPDYYNPVNGQSEQAYWELQFIDPEEIDDLFEIFTGLLAGKKAEDRLKARRKEKAA